MDPILALQTDTTWTNITLIALIVLAVVLGMSVMRKRQKA